MIVILIHRDYLRQCLFESAHEVLSFEQLYRRIEDIERQEALQQRLEALSQANIKERNNIDQRLKRQHRQGQEHIQQLPSAQSPNQTRTSCVMSQSALPHHPTVPPESDHKYAWDIEKRGEVEHYQLQQGQQYQQEQQDLQRLGQKDQLEQGKQDLQRLGQKKQLNQGQQDANCKGYCISARKIRLKTERWTLFLRLMVMLMISGCPVSGMCSTCLDGRCYDNGECIIGCQRGYVGKYCSEECPPGCVNNECYIDRIKGTVTCISGCEAGYCGAKCSLRCQEDCLTCDRQCGSCNMTLCPERRFGVGCSEICSQRYEKCDRENGQCIRCKRGYYGDECDKECLTCSTREDDISDKCLSGCEKCQTQETCAAGFYGEKCDHRCSSGCKQSEGDGASRRLCNRATGECSDGCVSGYHGLTCNYMCNKLCVGGVCNQYDRVCTSGCISGYSQGLQDCEEVQDTGKKDVSVSHTLLLLLIISVAVSALVVSLAVLVYARRTIRRGRINFKTENADKNERESLK